MDKNELRIREFSHCRKFYWIAPFYTLTLSNLIHFSSFNYYWFLDDSLTFISRQSPCIWNNMPLIIPTNWTCLFHLTSYSPFNSTYLGMYTLHFPWKTLLSSRFLYLCYWTPLGKPPVSTGWSPLFVCSSLPMKPIAGQKSLSLSPPPDTPLLVRVSTRSSCSAYFRCDLCFR